MPSSAKKVAIITGSATGVGAAAAIMLAQKGCHVVINYTRSEKEAQETAAECRKHGAETIVFKGDVAEDSNCKHRQLKSGPRPKGCLFSNLRRTKTTLPYQNYLIKNGISL